MSLARIRVAIFASIFSKFLHFEISLTLGKLKSLLLLLKTVCVTFDLRLKLYLQYLLDRPKLGKVWYMELE